MHVEAERSSYAQNILEKCASGDGYALFLRNLQPAYHFLESALIDADSNATLKLFDCTPLFPHSAISLNLAALEGGARRTKLSVLPEGRAYIERI